MKKKEEEKKEKIENLLDYELLKIIYPAEESQRSKSVLTVNPEPNNHFQGWQKTSRWSGTVIYMAHQEPHPCSSH